MEFYGESFCFVLFCFVLFWGEGRHDSFREVRTETVTWSVWGRNEEVDKMERERERERGRERA